MAERPAWKKSPVVAGAALLVKGYIPVVTTCDHCLRPLADAEGCTEITFKGKQAIYPCPHCREDTVRAFRATPERSS